MIGGMRFPLRRLSLRHSIAQPAAGHRTKNGLFGIYATSPRSPRRKTLRVRLALRIDDLLELAEHAHARQQLRQTGVRLALLLDRGDELAVLELDAVHGDVDLGHVDLVVLAVAESVLERLVGSVVPDVAEKRPRRPPVFQEDP